MSDQQRITLTEPATRALQMRQHIEAVAESILNDHRADEVFARALVARNLVHPYSSRNRLLIQWQSPMSRLVASLSAFDNIAKEQGAPAVEIGGRQRRVMIRAGAKAIWIWGRGSRERVLHDALVEQDRIEVSIFYTPCSVWQAEDIVVASTGAALLIPDHVMGVDDLRLYAGLMAFATSRGITVEHRGLHGPRGLSSGGRISLQHGDSEAVQLPVLAHEIIHELLHHSRDGRQLPKTTVESEAETGAAVLMQHYGHDVPATPAYLRNYNVRPADVLASMDRIIRATSEVVGFIESWEGEQ